MRKNLTRFLVCLIAIVLLSQGRTTPRAIAHDLPVSMTYARSLTDCLGIERILVPAEEAADAAKPAGEAASPATQPPVGIALSSSVSSAFALSELTFQAVRQSSLVQQLTRRVDAATQLWSADHDTQSQALFASRPAAGKPPAPAPRPASQVAGRSIAKQRLIEDYMPYDLCVRDWRFGQFSYRGLGQLATADPATAEIADDESVAEVTQLLATEERQPRLAPSPAAIQLGEWLASLEVLECQLFAQLADPRAVQTWGATAAEALLASTDWAHRNWQNALETRFAPPAAAAALAPTFVVYEQAGKKFLIPAEQARQWDWLRQRPAASDDSERMLLTKWRSQALSLASDQLESLGHRLLNWSTRIGAIAEPHVAAKPARPIR